MTNGAIFSGERSLRKAPTFKCRYADFRRLVSDFNVLVTTESQYIIPQPTKYLYMTDLVKALL